MIPLNGFAPDAEPTTQGILLDATNIIPTMRGIRAAPKGVSSGFAALAATCIGAAALRKLDGTYRTFAGTTTKIYEASSLAWADVSRATPAYTAATSGRWRFAQFGNSSLAIDGRGADVLQRSTSGAFANVTGAPAADCIATAAGFVIVAGTNEGTFGDSSDRWWCSAFLDETSWTPSVTTQAASGRLVDVPGAITALRTLGSDLVAYKRNGIFLGRYTGAPDIWRWQHIPGEGGALSHEAVVTVGSQHFFVGDDDFWRFDGSRPERIGGPVREWFFGRLDQANDFTVAGMHDRRNACIWWWYPMSGSGLAQAVIYHYRTQRWGVASVSIEVPVEIVTNAITYDTLGNLYTTWDDLPAIAYDSPFWLAASLVPAYFDTSHALQQLTGSATSSSWTTGDIGDDWRYSLLRRVRVRYRTAPSSATMTNSYKATVDATPVTDATASISDGRFDVLRSARWHRLSIASSGDFEATGIDVDMVPEGSE